MADLKFDASIIENTSSSIQAINSQINSDFETMANEINRFSSVWNSAAKNAVIGKFKSIESSSKDARFDKMQDFSKYLNELILPGYQETENENLSLADMFI